jgi:putative ABC transport system permease protein
MSSLLRDIQVAARQWSRQRGSSLVALLTLALGIGVSTAVLSVVDAMLLRPLPYPSPGQLVSLWVEEVQPDGRI